MNRLHIRLCCAVAFLFATSLAAQFSEKQALTDCQRVDIKVPLLWMSSAEWISSRAEVAVVDPLQNAVIFINPQTGVGRYMASSSLNVTPRDFVPATIERVGKGYVLKMIDSRVFPLDEKFNPQPSYDLLTASVGPRGTLGSLYDFVGAEGFLLAYGAVKVPGAARSKFGFVQIPLEAPARFNFLLEYTVGDYYLVGNHYLEGGGLKGYFVLMGEKASIYEVSSEGGLRKLNSFPHEFSAVPPLQTQSTGPGSDEALYRELEGYSIASGIYFQDGYVYLLTRQPSTEGTLWYLYKIDPAHDEIKGRVQLPTRANHLSLVPADQTWVVFERGPVGAQGQQEIKSVLTISSTSVQSLRLPATCPTKK